MKRKTQGWVVLSGVGAWVAIVGLTLPGAASRTLAEEPKADPALERTREQIKMLDALYKNAVVSITERYKRGQPAIMVAKDVFKAMDEAKHHSARLVDASGEPLSENNVPKTEFEKRAYEAIREGKPHFEEIVGSGENRRLLAATVVPAVHQRCADCHGVEKGDLLGFIRYDLLIK